MIISENFIHGIKFTIKFQVRKFLVTYYQLQVLIPKDPRVELPKVLILKLTFNTT